LACTSGGRASHSARSVSGLEEEVSRDTGVEGAGDIARGKDECGAAACTEGITRLRTSRTVVTLHKVVRIDIVISPFAIGLF
jgi:hypothetical protein